MQGAPANRRSKQSISEKIPSMEWCSFPWAVIGRLGGLALQAVASARETVGAKGGNPESGGGGFSGLACSSFGILGCMLPRDLAGPVPVTRQESRVWHNSFIVAPVSCDLTAVPGTNPENETGGIFHLRRSRDFTRGILGERPCLCGLVRGLTTIAVA